MEKTGYAGGRGDVRMSPDDKIAALACALAEYGRERFGFESDLTRRIDAARADAAAQADGEAGKGAEGEDGE